MAVRGRGLGHLHNIPGVLVVMARQDAAFGARLLNPDCRKDALRDAGLTAEEFGTDYIEELHGRLEEIAQMSFQDAMQELREEGVAQM
jgi:hypothetical protein